MKRFLFVLGVYAAAALLCGTMSLIGYIDSHRPPERQPSTQPSTADPKGGPFRDIDLVVPVL
jgi:hypothetical protein